MSFSLKLKTELSKIYDGARHCAVAELAALWCFGGGSVARCKSGKYLSVITENLLGAEIFSELIKKLFGASCEIQIGKSTRNLRSFLIDVDPEYSNDIFSALKFKPHKDKGELPDISALVSKNCCGRAFLRGAFIAAGSISNPDKYYHFEIAARSEYLADETAALMRSLSIYAKKIRRHGCFVVYLKEIEQISDMLGFMGARTSLLELENLRIIRETRGNVNRRVNCETANINKTAMAAARQIQDILYIHNNMGLSSLPNGLDEIARIRLVYPEATLSELGDYLKPPIGKSGVNHRLRSIRNIAEDLRSRGGSYYDKEAGDDTDF